MKTYDAFVSQDSWWNPLLTLAARLTGCNYFWFIDKGKRRLWFGREHAVGVKYLTDRGHWGGVA